MTLTQQHLQLDLTAKVADLCLPRPYPGAQHPPITVGDTELCSFGGSRSFPVSQSTCNSSPQFARPGRPSSTTPPHCPALSPALPASNHSRLRGPPRVGSPLLTLSPSDTSWGRGPPFEPRSRHLGQKGRTEGWEGGKNSCFIRRTPPRSVQCSFSRSAPSSIRSRGPRFAGLHRSSGASYPLAASPAQGLSLDLSSIPFREPFPSPSTASRTRLQRLPLLSTGSSNALTLGPPPTSVLGDTSPPAPGSVRSPLRPLEPLSLQALPSPNLGTGGPHQPGPS